uniref:Uncharacterized protein n=1 Tax=Sinocyclocheilus anshuiensis TaxID=1608454 RepID=A0A671K835_9TELE
IPFKISTAKSAMAFLMQMKMNLNYGGVYVGLPADLTSVAASQSKSTRKGEEHIQRKTEF